MSKKVKTTCEEYVDSLTPQQKKEFDNEFRNFALSELILVAMKKDDVSVRQLAKLAGISPTIVQDLRSGNRDDFSMRSVLKVLSSLGFKVLLERDGELTPLDTSWISRS